MLKQFTVLITIMLLIGMTSSPVKGVASISRNYNISKAISTAFQEQQKYGKEVYGEVRQITPQSLNLTTSNGASNSYQLTEETHFFCNGRACSWQALRPVTKQAFFEARLLVDQKNRVLMVLGYYYGEEFLVKEIFSGKEGWQLRLFSVVHEKETVFFIDKGVFGIFPQLSLQKDQVIYVLYGYYQKLRAIYTN